MSGRWTTYAEPLRRAAGLADVRRPAGFGPGGTRVAACTGEQGGVSITSWGSLLSTAPLERQGRHP